MRLIHLPILNYYATAHLDKKDYLTHSYIKMVDFLNILKLNHKIVYQQFFLAMTGHKLSKPEIISIHDNVIYLFNSFNNVYSQ